MQQWIAVIGTGLGAIIGLASAFANDRVRWNREQLQDRRGVRRDLYSAYIAALTEIHESMRTVSRDKQLPAARRASEIHAAFHAGGPYKLRYQIALVADQAVLDASEHAFQQMRDIRDIFASGGRIESPQYQTQRDVWGARLRTMQRAMREELGSAAVEFTGGS
ncbi:MAG: hypothetical protein ABSC06_33600 [Rhodopila sp.]